MPIPNVGFPAVLAELQPIVWFVTDTAENVAAYDPPAVTVIVKGMPPTDEFAPHTTIDNVDAEVLPRLIFP